MWVRAALRTALRRAGHWTLFLWGRYTFSNQSTNMHTHVATWIVQLAPCTLNPEICLDPMKCMLSKAELDLPYDLLAHTSHAHLTSKNLP